MIVDEEFKRMSDVKTMIIDDDMKKTMSDDEDFKKMSDDDMKKTIEDDIHSIGSAISNTLTTTSHTQHTITMGNSSTELQEPKKKYHNDGGDKATTGDRVVNAIKEWRAKPLRTVSSFDYDELAIIVAIAIACVIAVAIGIVWAYF